MASVLNFELLDDCLIAKANGEVAAAEHALRSAQPRRIGPLLEYAIYRGEQDRSLPPLNALRQHASTTLLAQAIECVSRSNGGNTSLQPESVEFSWGPADTTIMGEPRWVAFCKRLEHAAQGAGLGNHVASAITGAFREIVENAIIHSDRPQTMLTGYSWSPQEVEFVVADSGIGVLQSLRTCPELSELTDHGDALKAAVTDGVSRFGRASGHGRGFRPIFVNLVGIKGFLRFRSGDHALQMTAINPDLSRADLRQRPFFQGLMANLVCRRPSNKKALSETALT